MRLKTYTNPEKLLTDLEEDIIKSVNNIHQDKDFQDKLLQSIYYSVYLYSLNPEARHTYRNRGEQGGLLDPKNIVSENTVVVPGGVETTIRTATRPNSSVPGGMYPGMENLYLDEIIVTGIGYSWKNSVYHKDNSRSDVEYPIERDFYANATNPEHARQALRRLLKKEGWDV